MTDGQHHTLTADRSTAIPQCMICQPTHTGDRATTGLTNTHATLTAATCKKFGDRVLRIKKVSVNLRCRNF